MVFNVNFLWGDRSESNLNSQENHVNTIQELADNGHFMTREIYLEYSMIPAIGQPISLLTAYIEQRYSTEQIKYGEEDYYEAIVMITQFYQHAGTVCFEQYIFDTTSNLIYSKNKFGFGFYQYPDSVNWVYENTFYFNQNDLIKAVYQKEEVDVSDQKINYSGIRRLERSQFLMDIFDNFKILAPPIFTEYLMR